VIDSVISGNYSLSRVLPTLYAVNRAPINAHAMTLVSILPNCDNAEKLALLAVFVSMAKDNPAVRINGNYTNGICYQLLQLLEPSVPQLSECLLPTSTSAAASSALQVFYHLAASRPKNLADHLPQVSGF